MKTPQQIKAKLLQLYRSKAKFDEIVKEQQQSLNRDEQLLAEKPQVILAHEVIRGVYNERIAGLEWVLDANTDSDPILPTEIKHDEKLLDNLMHLPPKTDADDPDNHKISSLSNAKRAARLYAEAIIPPAIPDPDMVTINWKNLRDKYFEECVTTLLDHGLPHIHLAPHDMFEWFKNQIQNNK